MKVSEAERIRRAIRALKNAVTRAAKHEPEQAYKTMLSGVKTAVHHLEQ